MKCQNCRTENPEGAKFCKKCGRSLQPELVCPQCGHTNPEGKKFCNSCGHALAEPAPTPTAPPSPEPTSFAGGRYQVKGFLGEGGKKKVYLAHDTVLARDIVFKLSKTEGLDAEARARITREAKAMGRLGSHQHIMTIFDQGEQDG